MHSVSQLRARIGRPIAGLLAGLFICLSTPQQVAAETSAKEIAPVLIQLMESGAPAGEEGTQALAEALRDFYRARSGAPLWFGAGAEGQARLAAGLEVLADAGSEGIDPNDYRLSLLAGGLAEAAKSDDAATLAATELQATLGLLRYARDVSVGRTGPARTDPNVFVAAKTFDPAPVLNAFADPAANPGDVLRAMPPSHREYAGLRDALRRYTELRGEPRRVDEGPALKPGMRDPRVAQMRTRLAFFGDLGATGAEADPELYTPLLAQAVRRFQTRHGLETDAIAGAQTLGALNVAKSERLHTIRLNMERWRWLPHELGERFVLVNIAGFQAEMVEDGRVVDQMRAVVGRTYRMTPVFSDRISYVEVNPTWTVPPKIARKDLLPRIKADPGYLAEGGYEVFAGWGEGAARLDPSSIDWSRYGEGYFPFRLRQRPGPKNALGEVKVMFPNRFDVYLHDTPARELFQRSVRAYSSGCIRLERPFDMVNWLMNVTGGPGPGEIDSLRESRKTAVVGLPDTVPVHLIYATAWTSPGGNVHFRHDIYNRDRLLNRSLQAR
ncbi:L,D-transpeptidase family protein [Minwuia thermotolerans]|nr:L,D-transpeptidase family protein [Minwuia thermotolerans]